MHQEISAEIETAVAARAVLQRGGGAAGGTGDAVAVFTRFGHGKGEAVSFELFEPLTLLQSDHFLYILLLNQERSFGASPAAAARAERRRNIVCQADIEQLFYRRNARVGGDKELLSGLNLGRQDFGCGFVSDHTFTSMGGGRFS